MIPTKMKQDASEKAPPSALFRFLTCDFAFLNYKSNLESLLTLLGSLIVLAILFLIFCIISGFQHFLRGLLTFVFFSSNHLLIFLVSFSFGAFAFFLICK